MEHYAKVEGHPNLLRDMKSNAIINTDQIALDNYTSIKRRKELEQQRINTIESDLSEVKSSIEEIKQLLRNMTNGSR
jgi:chaperonin cofactor prefoldin